MIYISTLLLMSNHSTEISGIQFQAVLFCDRTQKYSLWLSFYTKQALVLRQLSMKPVSTIRIHNIGTFSWSVNTSQKGYYCWQSGWLASSYNSLHNLAVPSYLLFSYCMIDQLMLHFTMCFCCNHILRHMNQNLILCPANYLEKMHHETTRSLCVICAPIKEKNLEYLTFFCYCQLVI